MHNNLWPTNDLEPKEEKISMQINTHVVRCIAIVVLLEFVSWPAKSDQSCIVHKRDKALTIIGA